jgi:hypothetical protein
MSRMRAARLSRLRGRILGSTAVYEAPARLRLNNGHYPGDWTMTNAAAVLNNPMAAIAYAFMRATFIS